MTPSAPAIPRQRQAGPDTADASIIAGFGPTEGAHRAGHRSASFGLCCGGAAVLCSVLPGGRGAAIGLSALGAIFAVVTLRGIRRRGGAARGPVQVCVGFVLVVCVGLLASQVAFASADGRSRSAEPGPVERTAVTTPAGVPPVRIGLTSVAKTADGLVGFSLAFTVTNPADRTRSVDVGFRALGPRGDVIARDSAHVANLGAGQSAVSSVFNLVGPGRAYALKRATFQVTEATWYD